MTYSKFFSIKFLVASLGLVFCCLSFFLISSAVEAEDDWGFVRKIETNRAKKEIFASLDGSFSLIVPAGTSTQSAYFKFTKYSASSSLQQLFPDFNQDIKLASDLIFYELLTSNSAEPIKTEIAVKFSPNNRLLSPYYWNENSLTFEPITYRRDTKKNQIIFNPPAETRFVFGLFEEPVQTGKASWYVHPKYKKELMAASVDFSFGSQVLVTNLANNKSVVVTIKDYGPDKSVHPDRVIDLGKEAFRKIASVGAGIIDVKVEPYLVNTSTAIIANNLNKK